MSRVRLGLLLLAAFLIIVGLAQGKLPGEGPVGGQTWGSMCDWPGETQSCLQSCRGAFDPDKDYAGYSMCLKECRIACKKAKKRGFY